MSSLWKTRALAVGPTRDRRPDPRFFTSVAARVITGLLPGAPVCCYADNAGRLDHPPRARIADFTVGRVTSAHFEGSSVFAVIAIENDQIRHDLLAREREGRLQEVGVSLQLNEPQLGPAMGNYWMIEGAAGVISLDLIDDPAGDRACVLRSVAPEEEPNYDDVAFRSFRCCRGSPCPGRRAPRGGTCRL